MFLRLLLFLCVIGHLIYAPVYAVTPNERLVDPALEARARIISKDLRCPVCQNQSIDDSNADLSKDLRRLVRERLLAGESDTQVKAYLQQRYGDYILLTPPIKQSTYILWFTPFLFVMIGAIGYVMFIRQWSKDSKLDIDQCETTLSSEEEKKLKIFLTKDVKQSKDR